MIRSAYIDPEIRTESHSFKTDELRESRKSVAIGPLKLGVVRHSARTTFRCIYNSQALP
jgi:hypothetical protein